MQPTPFDCAQVDAGLRDFFSKVSNGDRLAADFLCRFMAYCHGVDDVIDESKWDAETLLALLVQASEVYSHEFYRMHVGRLQTPILTATSVYADSIKWEKDPALWKREWAEVTRHAGNEVILAVALICGGFAHLRDVSAPLYATCFVYHKDRYGTPTEPRTERTATPLPEPLPNGS